MMMGFVLLIVGTSACLLASMYIVQVFQGIKAKIPLSIQSKGFIEETSPKYPSDVTREKVSTYTYTLTQTHTQMHTHTNIKVLTNLYTHTTTHTHTNARARIHAQIYLQGQQERSLPPANLCLATLACQCTLFLLMFFIYKGKNN